MDKVGKLLDFEQIKSDTMLSVPVKQRLLLFENVYTECLQLFLRAFEVEANCQGRISVYFLIDKLRY